MDDIVHAVGGTARIGAAGFVVGGSGAVARTTISGGRSVVVGWCRLWAVLVVQRCLVEFINATVVHHFGEFNVECLELGDGCVDGGSFWNTFS